MLKKLKKIDFVCIFIIISYMLILFTYKDSLLANTDNIFLVNRAEQMLNCLKDGNIPFFYYDDFNGIGYGSSFFYGQLTLYPFLLLLHFGKLPFLYGYIFVCLILNIIGIKCFTKRFCTNYKFVSNLYLMSISFFMLFTYTQLFACLMGQGLGFLFLAYLIDFLRDNKNMLPSGILFFLVLNTHLLTVLVVFLIAIYIGILYFDKKKIKEYIFYFVYVLSLCLYFICNYIYHSEAINDIQAINRFSLNKGIIKQFGYTTPIGLLESSLFTRILRGNTLFDIGTFIVLIYLIIKNYKKYNKKEKLTIISCVILIIFSLNPIWTWFNLNIYTLSFQFPLRYVPFLLVYLYIIVFKNCNKELEIFLKSYTLFLFIILMIMYQISEKPNTSEYIKLDKYVGNGEYVSKDFKYTIEDLLNTKVYDNNGIEYKYKEEKGKITIDINTNNTKEITIPKLYYKGYKVKMNGKELKILSKITNFIKVKVKGCGKLEVYYEQPIWLQLLDLICLLELIYILRRLICKKNKK